MTRRRKLTHAERAAKAERNDRRNRAGLLRARAAIAEHSAEVDRARGAGLELAGGAEAPLPPPPVDVEVLRAAARVREAVLGEEPPAESDGVLLGPDGRPLER